MATVGHCRTSQHHNANMRHGGVGTFVCNDLYESYKISVIDQSYEGILGILFQHNTTDHQFIVFCVIFPLKIHPGVETVRAFIAIWSVRFIFITMWIYTFFVVM